MFKFNSKQDDSKQVTYEDILSAQQESAIITNRYLDKVAPHKKAFPLGKKFKYLGIDMIIVKNVSKYHMPYGLCGFDSYEKCLLAEYLDGNGNVMQKDFSTLEFESILGKS